jgi:formylmethanofuran dehydrogenase subunit E
MTVIYAPHNTLEENEERCAWCGRVFNSQELATDKDGYGICKDCADGNSYRLYKGKLNDDI